MLRSTPLQEKAGKAKRSRRLSMKGTVKQFWKSSEDRLVQWLSCEMNDNPHLERVLNDYCKKMDCQDNTIHLTNLRQPIFSEMWY